jgi:hypothetical protein
VPLKDLAVTLETHGRSARIASRKEGLMKFIRGMYPKLALVAVLVSLAIASGAAKKWA